jgi:DNA-binding LacI/PurR family transcriptional regulator
MNKSVPRTPTLEDVARVAGVSRATVSRVINGIRNVDADIQEAVRKAIRTTGYTPNQAARSLVTRRAGTIALVMSGAGVDGDEFAKAAFADPFFGRVAGGVVAYVRTQGVHPVLMLAETTMARLEVLDFLRRGNADGALLVSTHPEDPLPGMLTEHHLPAVLFARPTRPLPVSYVDLAHQDGGALAADHLVARGCQRVATICGPLDVPAAQDRLAGFRTSLEHHGYPYLPIAEGDFTQQSGETAMQRLLLDHPDLDGVFAANDLMAHGAVLVLQKAGRRVPDDVAVVGFDDSPPALASRPRLTTVRQPVEEMAAEMARLLLARIEDPDQPPRQVVFNPTLIVRESA